MSETLEMTRNEERAVEVRPAANLLEAITRAASDPRLDIDKFERLLAMQERLEAQQRKERFDVTLAELQQAMPRIEKNGLINMGGKGQIKYSKLEDVDAALRPIYGPRGFSVRYDAPQTIDGSKIRIIARWSMGGHTEALEITLPPDQGPGRSPVQAVKSSITAARRHLTEMFFNIIEEGADDQSKPITQEEADTLRDALASVNANMPQFLRVFKVESLEDLMKSRLDEAYRMIEAKRRK